jgi:hypothetical protein
MSDFWNPIKVYWKDPAGMRETIRDNLLVFETTKSQVI